jgi:hypothetical protein
MQMLESFDSVLHGDGYEDDSKPREKSVQDSKPKKQAKPTKYIFDRGKVFGGKAAVGRKGSIVCWQEESQANDEPANEEPGKRTQRRDLEYFMGVNATMVDCRPAVIKERLFKWVNRDATL